MNQRLLRPRASGFDPRSISGLALWLDAADTQSLYTTDAGPVTAVSAPTDISGCVGWWDASDAASITQSSGLVSQWNDKSGGNRHATASSTARPTTGTRTVGGRNALDFNGSSTVMSVSGSLPTAATHTVFAVFQLDATPAGTGPAIYSTQAATDQELRFVGSGSSAIQYMFNNNLGTALQTTPVGVSPVVVSVREATPIARSAGAGINASVTGSASAWAATGLVIGGRLASRFFDGVICELVIYDSTLSDAATASVEAYLAAKWGISGVHRAVPDELTAVSSPLDISGCALWLDADNTSSLTFNDSTVSEWRDLSGNDRHFAQATAASQPSTSTLNGRRVLSASGASFMTGNAASLNVLRNVGGGTLIVVGSLGSGDQQNLVQISNGTSAAQARLSLVRVIAAIGGLGIAGRRLDADSFAGAGYSAGTGSNVYTGILDYANSDAFTFAGGTQQASSTSFQTNGNTSDTDSLGTSVFGSPTGANLCTGTLAEVLIWPRVLTPTDRARVEKYLAQKWGIANVPDPTPPVGYWRDKSGNNRHATQATGGSRPTIASYFAAKSALSFDGSDDHLRADAAATVFNSADQSASMIAVVTPSTSSATVVASAGPSNGSSSLAAMYTGTPTYWLRDTNATGDQAVSAVRAGGEKYMMAGVSSETARSLAINGAVVSSVTQTIGTLSVDRFTVGALGRAANTSLYNGRVAELLVYARTLSGSERQRIERYLAAKWGITLAPQVSNADAQDWVNRVYANSGTVSSTTATAVNAFCNDIDAAGLRDRFYRLNLFCGTADASLIAVRTPLYRGPSLAGTQYGNTLDANINFAITDYAETGAGGGLKGDGSTKSLNTGVAHNAIPATDSHLMAYESVMGTQAFGSTVGASGNKTPNAAWFLGYPSPANTVRYGAMVQAAYAISSSTGPAMFLGSNDATTTRIYRNGTLTGSVGSNTARTPDTDHVIVFGMSFTTSVINRSSARLNAYSLGLGMTQQQQADFYTAMQALQTALGRNV